eukprot:363079-Chlamydomonas_euryale.AAC.7
MQSLQPCSVSEPPACGLHCCCIASRAVVPCISWRSPASAGAANAASSSSNAAAAAASRVMAANTATFCARASG